MQKSSFLVDNNSNDVLLLRECTLVVHLCGPLNSPSATLYSVYFNDQWIFGMLQLQTVLLCFFLNLRCTKYHSEQKFSHQLLFLFPNKATNTESANQSIFLSERMIPAGIQTGLLRIMLTAKPPSNLYFNGASIHFCKKIVLVMASGFLGLKQCPGSSYLLELKPAAWS